MNRDINKVSPHYNKYANNCNIYIKELNECEKKDKILSSNKENEFYCNLIKQLYDGCIGFKKNKLNK
jgi:hypothetical protein